MSGSNDPITDVLNQPAPRGELRLWDDDPALRLALSHLKPAILGRPQALADLIGLSGIVEKGHRLATGPGPDLERFDAGGRRIDRIIYPESYHALLETGLQSGYAALPWITSGEDGHRVHAAMVYLMSQVEPGVCCPMTMTYAAIPALRRGDGLASDLVRLATAQDYDRIDTPIAHKRAATVGMAMTEKQGGSDVRANTTIAEPADDAFQLTGHKWFCSAPMSDAFLTLAQLPEGLTCFVVPRRLADGSLNAVHLMRLKNKLGNRANASAEIEYRGAYAEVLGEPGQGVRTILEMVHHTRLDTAIAPVGLMRRALTEALYWARNRAVFDKPLIDQPLMTSVLADLTLEWLGAFSLAMRVANAFDAAKTDEGEAAFARLAVAIAKYWNNKRCPIVTVEAMECLGGMGYVEDTPMPWLYREAPLNAIWEGSGNVICLDVLRTLEKLPAAGASFIAELELACGVNPAYDSALDELARTFAHPLDDAAARRLTERMALLLQTSLLLRQPDTSPGEVFTATRVAGDWGHTLGTLPSWVDTRRIIALADG